MAAQGAAAAGKPTLPAAELRLLRASWARFQAQAYLERLRRERRRKQAMAVWHAALRTFKCRLLHDFQVVDRRESKAAALIAGHVLGAQVRRRHKVKQVSQHLARLRFELEDVGRQLLQRAALKLQRRWRSWWAQVRALCGKLVAYLDSERRARAALTQHEVQDLLLTRHGQGRSSMSAPAATLQAVHAQVPRGSAPVLGWADALMGVMAEAAHVGVGDDFAVAVGRGGRAHLLLAEQADGRWTLGEPKEPKFRGPLHDRFRDMSQPPVVRSVSCGGRHALLITGDGLLFAWGANDCLQCGMGGPAALGDGPEQFFHNPTCVQTWAHGGTFDQRLEPTEKAGEGGMPRARGCACGPRHSGAIDSAGAAWLWGRAEDVGLSHLRPKARPGKRAAPSFLLFQLSRAAGSAEDKLSKAAGSCPSEDKACWQRSSSSGGLLAGALAECEAEVLEGHIAMPTLCGAMASCRRGSEKWRTQEFLLVSRAPDRCATLGVARGELNSRFVSLELGPEANFVLSDRSHLYSWGRRGATGALGRATNAAADVAEPPARIPALVRMSIAVSQVALGARHVVVLSSHGRVFTWGTMEACLGPDGFRQHVLAQPVFLEGALGHARVARVAAGRAETVVSLHHGGSVLGWEMVEAAEGCRRMLPVVYEFPFLASSFDEDGDRQLLFSHSEAFAVLLVERRAPRPATGSRAGSRAGSSTASVSSLHSATPARAAGAASARAASARAAAQKARAPGTPTAPRPAAGGQTPSPGSVGVAGKGARALPEPPSSARCLFEWAARAREAQEPPLSRKTTPIGAIHPSDVARPRSNLEVVGDLLQYRWLQARLEGMQAGGVAVPPTSPSRRRGAGEGRRFPGGAVAWGQSLQQVDRTPPSGGLSYF